VSSVPLCRSFGATATLDATILVPCTDGIRAVRVDAGGVIGVAWHTPTGADGPPVAGGGAVWSVAIATGTLFALDAGSGSELARLDLGPVPHFASPALADGMVLVGTMDGVVAVRVGP